MDAHEKAMWETGHRLDESPERVKRIVELYLLFRSQDADDPAKVLGKTPKWFTDKHPDYHPEKMTEIWQLIWSWGPK
jgi:hypothetical protein